MMPVLKPFSQQETNFTNTPLPHPTNPKQHYMWEFAEIKKTQSMNSIQSP